MPNEKKAELLTLFDKEIGVIGGEEGWYRRAKCRWRAISYLFRMIAVLAFVGGALAPFTGNLMPSWDEGVVARWGYALLVLAGLSFAVDQFFVASRNWGRFAKAELEIGLVRRLLALDRAYFAVRLADDSMVVEHLAEAHQKLVQARREVGSIQLQETESWSGDLEKALDRFERLVRSAAEAPPDDRRPGASASGTGAIRVAIEAAERAGGRALVEAGEELREYERLPATLVLDRQAPGVRRVTVKWCDDDGGWRALEEATVVEPGKITSVAFRLDPVA